MQQRHRVASGRPECELGLLLQLGDCDAAALEDEALEEEQQQQAQAEPVVQEGVEMRWTQNQPSPERHAEADDGEDPEDVAHQRVAEIEGAAQEVHARPLLQRDHGRRHQLGQESVEDEEMDDGRERSPPVSSLADDLHQETPDAFRMRSNRASGAPRRHSRTRRNTPQAKKATAMSAST